MSSSASVSVFDQVPVALFTSTAADCCAVKNNLTLSNLLLPFCTISQQGEIRDPASGSIYSVKNLKLSVLDINHRPPQPVLARKLLNESVSGSYSEKTTNVQVGNYNIDIPAATPWFESWKETFFRVQFPSDHEFTKHFVACLLVASTTDPNPMEAFAHLVQQLSQLQNAGPSKLPKWFNSNILRCFVLLHDATDGNIDKAEKYFDSLKNTYGAGNCFFLSINSRKPNEIDGTPLPDPWSKYLPKPVENNESSADNNTLPRTPADISTVTSMPTTLGSAGSMSRLDMTTPPCEKAIEASEGSITVQVHPLSPAEETSDSLTAPHSTNSSSQNDILSSSAETDPPVLNPNVWKTNLPNDGSHNVHGAYLTTQDMENIKSFVQDFAIKALLPYFERQLYQLNDIISAKKGRSILSATKRWFSTNKPGTNAPINNSVIYSGDCAELQLRRLGDIWFMLGQWNLAFQAYHTAKREYSADSAWLYYAGALEMAALSAFMGNEASRKTFDYMEESITTYLNACRMPQFAVRATLLSIQCLSNKGLHSEAAKQLIRMTSEDCDLRSALLLEQASLCFLAGPSKHIFPRKYAFHMVLAGHRYSKAGQKKHSLRCYRHAYQVYRGGGWRLATDHIEFAIGRLAGQVKSWDAATSALSSLLAPQSMQPPAQQTAFLREYLHVHQQWVQHRSDQQSSLPLLPVPLLKSNMTAVLCSGPSPPVTPGKLAASGTQISAEPSNVTNKHWAVLEEMLLHKVRGNAPMIFKPSVSLFCESSDNSSNPNAPQGESIRLMVQFHNPLQIDISIMDVQLLWTFKSISNSSTLESNTENTLFSNETCILSSTEYDKSVVVTEKIPLILLHNDRINGVLLSLTPLHPGELNIVGVAYRLCNPIPPGEETPNISSSVLGKQLFEIRGPKLNTKEVVGKPLFGVDKRLNIIVTPPAPCLQVTFSQIQPQLLCGELQKINVEIKNVGKVSLNNLYIGISHPQHIALSNEPSPTFSFLYETRYYEPPPNQDEKQSRTERDRRRRNRHCLKVLDTLTGGETYSTVIWIRAPQQVGNHSLHVLFYYENSQSNVLPKHRLLRHSWNFSVLDSLQIASIAKHTLLPESNKEKYVEGLNISLELKNANQIHHGISTVIEIQQLSMLSQNWKLENLVPIHGNVKVLMSQKTLHIILRCRRNYESKSIEDILSSDLKLDENDNISSVKEKPFCNFVLDYPWNLEDDDFFGFFNATSASDLCNSQLIKSTLVIRWKSEVTLSEGIKRLAIGQHFINLDRLNIKVFNPPPPNRPDSLPLKITTSDRVISQTVKPPDADERLITFTLDHDAKVSHDFKKNYVCIIPVKMHIVNCSTLPVTAILNTSIPKSNTKMIGLGWVGIGGNDLGGASISLKPLESGILLLQAACTLPGTYSLGNILRLSCKIKSDNEETRTILQGHIATSTLVVSQIK